MRSCTSAACLPIAYVLALCPLELWASYFLWFWSDCSKSVFTAGFHKCKAVWHFRNMTLLLFAFCFLLLRDSLSIRGLNRYEWKELREKQMQSLQSVCFSLYTNLILMVRVFAINLTIISPCMFGMCLIWHYMQLALLWTICILYFEVLCKGNWPE